MKKFFMPYGSFHESNRDIRRNKVPGIRQKEMESSEVICSLKSIVHDIRLHMRAKITV
jgi:hypothetical protein